MINEFKFHVVAFTVFLCLATSLTAQTNPAAKEVMGEIKLLIQTCLSEKAKSQGSFQQLLKHGYSERVKKRFIVYNKTLKVRQAVLSRPKCGWISFERNRKGCAFSDFNTWLWVQSRA